MAYCGIENDDFCGNIDCLFAGSSFCSICDVSHGEGGYLKFYEAPRTIIESIEEYHDRLYSIPF